MLIREILSQKSMTIKQFCKKANINYDKFCTYLTNNIWTLNMLKRVSKALNFDLTDYVTTQSEASEE